MFPSSREKSYNKVQAKRHSRAVDLRKMFHIYIIYIF